MSVREKMAENSKLYKTAYLALENGRVFEGKFFGAAPAENIIGELVFNTSMTGYLEILTDNSYFGQIVLQTFPLIGNYGIISGDLESGSLKSVEASAYIVKSWCEEPSNFRSEGNLDAFLKSKFITGLYGIDTREVTKIIRENGVMNAKITSSKDDINFDEIKNYKIMNAVENVSCKEIKELKSSDNKYKVIMFDFGTRESIKHELLKRGCDVWLVPHNTAAEQVKSINPDGIVLSSGPGNPADNGNIDIINNLKEIIKLNIPDIPIIGIGLGHQLLALAHGFRTEKLKYGHRGANQPVKNLRTGTVYITSQNHGYTVVPDSIDNSMASALFENVNDRTCEGIIYKDKPMFSSEFYPESRGGTRDTGFLFDMFAENMDIKISKNGGI